MALGLDPDRSTFWIQSDVPQVCESTWLLSNIVNVGALDRATSYKDKLAKGLTANDLDKAIRYYDEVLKVLDPVSYTHLRAHETPEHRVLRLLV